MILNSVNIETLGFFVAEHTGSNDLPARKKVLNRTATELKDIMKNGPVERYVLCGEFDTAAALKSAVSALYALMETQPFPLAYAGSSYNAFVVEQIKTKVEHCDNKIIFWGTMITLIDQQ